ncbi:hypothetical protein [Streptomyces coelicoflavus]|uniref:hypothetical protein n=1 Tax=Streptomyces coelicoflavus TaxID=285562 RepID=UPI002E256AFA
MANYKYPRSITFTAALPMTATGKILKRELHPTQEQPAAPDTDPNQLGPGDGEPTVPAHQPGNSRNGVEP